ncbi:MAG: DegT/DnrJ/EryC1/StrS family aminotransferase [Christensenella sp.]|nr:DegT/DnrJ/EryC1/StrS family aminotransferase [Christensenella sp.]
MITIAKPQIGREEKDAVMEVMGSGMIASGSIVGEFEKEFASYIGMPYGVACTSGTTALEIGLKALGIGAGDKVITTAYSFIASTNGIVYTGATPVFADIDPRTFNIDIDSTEECLKQNPDAKALLVVHLFGQTCNMDRICELAEKYHVKLIEDCAQAHGAMWNDKKAGSFGDVSTFSFYPTKNMTTGEGGIVLTKDADVAEKARLVENHGMKVRYTHDIIGHNYRMTNIAAAIGREQLKKLDGFNDARRKNAEYYNDHISNTSVIVPKVAAEAKHVYHQYTIRVTDGKRDQLIQLFEQNQIGYGIFYPFSIPEQPCYKDMNFQTAYSVTDRIKKEVLSIPVHPGITEEDVKVVTEVINSL